MNLRDCDDSLDYFARASVADVVLSDHVLGRRVHHAVRSGYLFYDGQDWTMWNPRVVGFLLMDWQPIVWTRHWLTEGVIELEQDFRPRPGTNPLDLVMDLILPCRLVFISKWGDPYYAHARNLWNCNCGRTEAR